MGKIVSEAPRIILDVAHNPHAAGYLAQRLAQSPSAGRVLAVIGMLHDKDIAGTLACLERVVDSWYCAPLDGPRRPRRRACGTSAGQRCLL
ncbi:Dihydrofolate synthase / Folylpolyglutamate synthase [Cronobacter sakazakii 696]|nr:Dihydrofolate synthase / Folylpolyglutamate synthase [Cronobacter sakazakii 696]